MKRFLPLLALLLTIGCKKSPAVSDTTSTGGNAGAPSAAASAGPDDVDKVLQKSGFRLESCYVGAARRDKHPTGSMRLDLTIARDGRVRLVKVSDSTIQDIETQECIVKAMQTLRFAPSPNERTIQYPVSLEKLDPH